MDDELENDNHFEDDDEDDEEVSSDGSYYSSASEEEEFDESPKEEKPKRPRKAKTKKKKKKREKQGFSSEFFLGENPVEKPKNKQNKKRKVNKKKWKLSDTALDEVADFLKEHDFENIPEITEDEREEGLIIDEDEDIRAAQMYSSVLKPHQLIGVRFLWLHTEAGNGCILADYMGLGKTLQTITFLDTYLRNIGQEDHMTSKVRRSKKLKKKKAKVIVVAPASVVMNWDIEIKKWINPKTDEGKNTLRMFDVRVLDSKVAPSVSSRVALLKSWASSGGVLLTGYEMFRGICQGVEKGKGDTKLLKQARDLILNPDLIVLDEGHRLRHSKSQLVKAFSELKTNRRVVLTGYPLQNHLDEYWCMVNFARPGYLGSKDQFKHRFLIPIENGQASDATPRDAAQARYRTFVLVTTLKPIILRRDASYLARELPSKFEWVIHCKLTPLQTQLYRAFVRYRCNKTEEEQGQVQSNDPRASVKENGGIIAAYHHAMSIVNHPDIIYNNVKKRGSTLDLVVDDEGLFDDDNIDEAQEMSSSASVQQEVPSSSSSQQPQQQQPKFEPLEDLDLHPTSSSKNHNVTTSSSSSSSNGPSMSSAEMECVWMPSTDLLGFKRINVHSESNNWVSVVVVASVGDASDFCLGDEILEVVRHSGDVIESLDRIKAQNVPTTIRLRRSQSGFRFDEITEALDELSVRVPTLVGVLAKTPTFEETQVPVEEGGSRQRYACFISASMKIEGLQDLDEVTCVSYIDGTSSIRVPLCAERGIKPVLAELEKKEVAEGTSSQIPVELTIRRYSSEHYRYKLFKEKCDDGSELQICGTTTVKLNSVKHLLEWAEPLLINYKAGNFLNDSGKMRVLFSILRESRRQDSKLLIFSQSVTTLNVIQAIIDGHNKRVAESEDMENDDIAIVGSNETPYLSDTTCGYLRLDGSTPQQQRLDIVDRFNKAEIAEYCVFLASTRAAGEGLNLHTANRVVMFDVCWNPCLDHEAMCRAYRFGQKKKVYVYRLVAAGTMEKTILAQQNKKEGLTSRVVDARATKRKVTAAEMRKFFDIRGFNTIQKKTVNKDEYPTEEGSQDKMEVVDDDEGADKNDEDDKRGKDDEEKDGKEEGGDAVAGSANGKTKEELDSEKEKRNLHEALKKDEVLKGVLRGFHKDVSDFKLEDLLEHDESEEVKGEEKEKAMQEFKDFQNKEKNGFRNGAVPPSMNGVQQPSYYQYPSQVPMNAPLSTSSGLPIMPTSAAAFQPSFTQQFPPPPFPAQTYQQFQQQQQYAFPGFPQGMTVPMSMPTQLSAPAQTPSSKVFLGKKVFVLKRRMGRYLEVCNCLRNGGATLKGAIDFEVDYVITAFTFEAAESWREKKKHEVKEVGTPLHARLMQPGTEQYEWCRSNLGDDPVEWKFHFKFKTPDWVLDCFNEQNFDDEKGGLEKAPTQQFDMSAPSSAAVKDVIDLL